LLLIVLPLPLLLLGLQLLDSALHQPPYLHQLLLHHLLLLRMLPSCLALLALLQLAVT
jgi:hypothetical protein